MIQKMYQVILQFAQDSGVSTAWAVRAFANARRAVDRSPYRLQDALDFKVMLRISEALKAWYTKPEYLDPRGAPTPLPLSGARSVESLIARFVPELAARDTVRWLIREGALRRRSTGHLVPVRRVIRFIRPNAMTLDRIPFLLQGLLSTVSHNTEAKIKGRDTRFEQMLTLDRFRASALRRFNREVQKLAALLLNQLESWAAPYLEPEDSRRETARVGVDVFTYVEAGARRAKHRRKTS
jgi:hypothetical protein